MEPGFKQVYKRQENATRQKLRLAIQCMLYTFISDDFCSIFLTLSAKQQLQMAKNINVKGEYKTRIY